MNTNSIFHQSQLVIFFLSILNFGYFIRKIKQIHDKLWLVEQKVKHQKCYREFVFVNLPTTLHWYRIQIKGARSPIKALNNKLVESLVFDQYILIYNYKSYIISILNNIRNLFSDFYNIVSSGETSNVVTSHHFINKTSRMNKPTYA